MKSLLRFFARNAASGLCIGVIALALFGTLTYAQGGAPQVPVLSKLIDDIFTFNKDGNAWSIKEARFPTLEISNPTQEELASLRLRYEDPTPISDMMQVRSASNSWYLTADNKRSLLLDSVYEGGGEPSPPVNRVATINDSEVELAVPVRAPRFNGTFVGDGSGLTKVPSSDALRGKKVPVGGGFQKSNNTASQFYGCQYIWGDVTGDPNTGECGCPMDTTKVATAPNNSEYYWASANVGDGKPNWGRHGWPIICLLTIP